MSFLYLEWIARASEAANAQILCASCHLQEQQNPFLQPTRVANATQQVLDKLLSKRKDLKCTVCSPSAEKETTNELPDPYDVNKVNRPNMKMVNPEQHADTDGKYSGQLI
jgi:hypothetical protein